MKKVYPERLLPQDNYAEHLDVSNDIEICYLLHTAEKSVPLYDKQYLIRNIKHHFIPDRFMSGMSMNLVSIYRKSDTRYVVDFKANASADQDWKPKVKAVCPKKKLKVRRNVGYFGFRIADILSIKKQLPLKEKNGIKEELYEISTRIEHKPTRCNYWHYEIYLYAQCVSKADGPEGKVPELVAKEIFARNLGKNLPTKIMSEFINIIKWRSEMVAFHIAPTLYCNS